MENQEDMHAMLSTLGKNLVVIGGLYTVYFCIYTGHIKSG